MIHIGGVYTTFCQEEGILLQKHRDRNGKCIAILFKSIGVRGRREISYHAIRFASDLDWRVPNPPGASPLVAERAPWRSSQSCVTGGQQPIGNPYRLLSFLQHTWQPPVRPQQSLVGKALSATRGLAPGRSGTRQLE